MSAPIPPAPHRQILVADLRVIGDDVERDLPILKEPYALRILYSLYDHAASKLECPYAPERMKPEARRAIEGLAAADLLVVHPQHAAQVTHNLISVTPTIALAERGRNVIEAHQQRKLTAGALDAVEVAPTGGDVLS